MIYENDKLQILGVTQIKAKPFEIGIEAFKTVFGNVDFNKPFRLIVDYSLEQLNVVVRKCFPTEDVQ